MSPAQWVRRVVMPWKATRTEREHAEAQADLVEREVSVPLRQVRDQPLYADAVRDSMRRRMREG